MTQQERFEAWATSQGINITDNGFGGYDSQWTEGALAGWEAAQAQAAVEPVAWMHDETGLIVRVSDIAKTSYNDLRIKSGEFSPLYASPPTQAAVEPVGYFYLDYGGYKQVGDLISFPGCVKLYTSPPDDLKFRPDRSGVEVLGAELHEAQKAMREALEALCLPCDRWNKQQTEIVNAAIAALEEQLK